MKINLYAKDSKGNLLIWSCWILNKVKSCSLGISRGRVDGNKVITWEHNIVPKNVGRSNETTAYEQAESRLKSRVNRKKKRGYVELTLEQTAFVDRLNNLEIIEYLSPIISNERLDEEGFKKPMLAAQYYKSKKDWLDPTGKLWKDRKYYYILNPHAPKEKGAIAPKFPMMLQPKINGVRAFLYLDENKQAKIKSKEGLIYDAPVHITDWANMNIDIFGSDGSYILDGELYIHGESLQVIQSAVKARNLDTQRVKFTWFDIAIEGFSNKDRWQSIKTLKSIYIDKYLGLPIEVVSTKLVKTDETTQKLTDEFISQGYEGSILRNLDANYGFGSRKNNMLKLKRSISEDFMIIDVIPQSKRPDLGMFLCSHNGVEFTINPTFDLDGKIAIMLFPDTYKGKLLQTSFYEWTDANKPLHIIDTVVRDYE